MSPVYSLCIQHHADNTPRPDGHCDMQPSRIIKDYILPRFHIYVYVYLVRAGSLRICTWYSVIKTAVIMQVLYVSNKFEGKFLRFSDFEYVRDKRSYIQNAVYAYTPWVKKGDTIFLSISLLNIDRFSQFFHRRTQLELCNKSINKDPTSPQMWNVKKQQESCAIAKMTARCALYK